MNRPAFNVFRSLAVFLVSIMVIYYSCKKDFPRQAAVLTESMDKPTATANGKLIDLGHTAITDHGFCWDITENPTVNGYKIGT